MPEIGLCVDGRSREKRQMFCVIEEYTRLKDRFYKAVERPVMRCMVQNVGQ